MIRYPINKIIDLSTIDGPGLRTSIFVQKCNIHCLYCHNPETQQLCFHCGKCVSSCPGKALSIQNQRVVWNKEKCIYCDTCIQVCPNHSSPKIEYLTADEVDQRIKKNLGFIRGITVSGGECALYPSFLKELFLLAQKESLSCLMDSNGRIDYSLYPDLRELCDGVRMDIKSWNSKTFENLTGYPNELRKKNLKYLDSINKIEELRIVYVPGYVDVKACLDGIKATVQEEHIPSIRIKLITFRNNGVKGILANHTSPTKEERDEIEAYGRSLGFENIERR